MKAISIDQWRNTFLPGRWPKYLSTKKCKFKVDQKFEVDFGNLMLFLLLLLAFYIGLIDMQIFWALSCHLQYAGGRRNSLIPLLYISSLCFAFSSCIDLLTLLLKGFFAHFPTLSPITLCVLDTASAFSLVLFLLLPPYLLPLYSVCRRQPSGLCLSHSINPFLFIFSRQLSGTFIIQSPPWLNVLSKLIIREQTKCVHSQQCVQLLWLADAKDVKISADPSLFDKGLLLHSSSLL